MGVAFSHEVRCLLHDLPELARAILSALAPGGVYYAVMGAYVASPLMTEWHRSNGAASTQALRHRRGLATFEATGFDSAAGRLAIRFVPASGEGHHGEGRFLDWLDYYGDQKLPLRFNHVPERSACGNRLKPSRFGTI